MITPTPYVYHAHVIEAYDADTITVNIDQGLRTERKSEKLRLFGIDAWEVTGHERIKGIIARDWLRGLILDKDVVIRTHLDKTGKYGRLLAEIWLDDVCLNDEMVRLGHAVYWEY